MDASAETRDARAARRGRLARRLLRHHLPLFCGSLALTALFHVTYAANDTPRVTVAGAPPTQQEGHAGSPARMVGGPGALGHGAPQEGGHEQEGPARGAPGSTPGVAPGRGSSAPVVRRVSQTSPFLDALSVATGYVGLLLIAATLLLGPLWLLRHRRVPVSVDLRRDIGIWAAVVSAVHVVVGLQVHTQGAGSVLANFFSETGAPLLTTFGWANHVGLLATLVLLLLAGLSNDALLGRLGAERWKRLQRLNYALVALVVAHGVLYGIYHPKSGVYPVILGAVAVAVLAAQAGGIWLYRSRLSAGWTR